MNVVGWVGKRFGIETVERETPITNTVGVAATQILRNDGGRLSWLIVNLGATDVVVAFSQEVSLTNGIYIPANGGSLSISAEDDYTLPTKQVWAISTAATQIFVLEMLLSKGAE